MSADFNDVIKQGYAKVKNAIGLWQQNWLILRRPSSKGPLRLERFPDEKTSMLTESGKVVEMKDVGEVCRLTKDEKKHGLNVIFKSRKTYQMAFNDEPEVNSWLNVFREICLPGGHSHLLSSASNTPDSTFHVCLLQTPYLDVFGECLLQVTSEGIILLDVDDPTKKIVLWPLQSLRRYSRDNMMFTFESGRSCSTGEGLFVFNTIHGEEIYQQVYHASLAIAEAQRIMNAQANVNRSQSQNHLSHPSNNNNNVRRLNNSFNGSTSSGLERRQVPLPPVPTPKRT